MATEAPPASSLDLVTHTLDDLTQTADEAEDKYLEDVQHRITLLQKELSSRPEFSGSVELDSFWDAVRHFEDSGDHINPREYVQGKGFRMLVGRLQEIQTSMFAKRNALEAPIDPEQTIASAPRRDPLVDILIDKRVFLPHKDLQAQDQYTDKEISHAFAKVTEGDIREIARLSGNQVFGEDESREAIIHKMTQTLNNDRALIHRYESAVPDAAPPDQNQKRTNQNQNLF